MKNPLNRFERILQIVTLGILLPGTLLHSETPKSTPQVEFKTLRKGLYESGEPSGKLGCVNMVDLLNRYKKSGPVQEALRIEVKRERQVRKDILAQIEKTSKTEDVEAQAARQKQLKLYDKKTMAYLDKKQQELFEPVFKEIEDAVKKYGLKNKYAIIYPEPHPEAEDVTQEILKQLNQ